MLRWPVPSDVDEEVDIPAHDVVLRGLWTLPAASDCMVIFAHGSGSSRLSPRNRYVARALNEGGVGTLLMDLLTDEEERIDWTRGHLRFDVQLLASRVLRATDWVAATGARFSIGYFGASTGAAAALIAAAERPATIRAVVSRGGRPDLAFRTLSRVMTPTLLIVGARDPTVLASNQRALEVLPCEKRLHVVPARRTSSKSRARSRRSRGSRGIGSRITSSTGCSW